MSSPQTPTPDLRLLRTFVTLADAGHFGRAAATLGIRQPSLTQQIHALEAIIGTPLFTRRPHVRLTAAGETLSVRARRLLAQASRVVEETRRVARGESGTLALGFAASTLTTALPAAIRRFREEFPEVELRITELSSGVQADALRDGAIDLGIGREPLEEEGVKYDLVLREEIIAVLPPKHPAAAAGTIPLSALASEAFVHFPRAVAPGLYDRVVALCVEAGFTPVVRQTAAEWLTIVGLVEAGLGVSLAPASFRRLRWGDIAYVALAAPGGRTTVAVCTRESDDNPAVARFVGILRAESGRRRREPT